MRTVFTAMVMMACVGAVVRPAAGAPSGRSISTGIEYDVATGDGDNGVGAYVQYELGLRGPLALFAELSYVTGDFSVEAGSGTYTTIGLGGGVMFRGEWGNWTPYIGAGGANQFNDFDRLDYDDKLSMFWLVGARVVPADRLSADFSLRHRWLRIDSIDPTLDTLNMDAWVLRVGLAYEL